LISWWYKQQEGPFLVPADAWREKFSLFAAGLDGSVCRTGGTAEIFDYSKKSIYSS
jgi:hypothetical protein